MGNHTKINIAYGILAESLFGEEDDYLLPEACGVLGIVPGSEEAGWEFWEYDGCPNGNFALEWFGDVAWNIGMEYSILVTRRSNVYISGYVASISDVNTLCNDFDREAMDKLAEIAGVRAEYFAFVSRG